MLLNVWAIIVKYWLSLNFDEEYAIEGTECILCVGEIQVRPVKEKSCINSPLRFFLSCVCILFSFCLVPVPVEVRGFETTLLAAVLAVESLHKTEICTGSGQSHNQIKPSQVSSREPIHSHHKKWLFICVFSPSACRRPFGSS